MVPHWKYLPPIKTNSKNLNCWKKKEICVLKKSSIGKRYDETKETGEKNINENGKKKNWENTSSNILTDTNLNFSDSEEWQKNLLCA